MAKTIGTDVETYRRAVAFEAIELGRPRFDIPREVLSAVADGDPDARRKLAVLLLERDTWEQDAPSEFLAAHSYGYAIQHKARERLYKLAAIEGLAQQSDAALRASTDAELLALLAQTGDGTVPV